MTSRWVRWRRHGVLVVCIVGLTIWALTATAPFAPHVDSVLDRLAGMTEKQQDAFLEKNPALIVEFANTDPKSNAAYWKKAKASERADLVRLVPEELGSVAGIDYASRDEANRIVLAKVIKKAEAALVRNPGDAAEKRLLKAYKAIKSTIGGKRVPHRYLITLTPDKPPLAAVAIGDLDFASQVTFAVPGMGTYTDDMSLWTQSAQNIWDAQAEVGAPKNHAVVSWIGYVTPPPGIDATLGEYAARGAPRLAAEIIGLKESRKPDPPRAISIIAHSYGTTTASDALADNPKLGIYAFVMLGSAGVEFRIQHASDLHAQSVYAGEAAADPMAIYGRESRRDPRVPSFGARILSVDGDPTADLLPVTGHEPVLHSPWNDDPLSSAWSGIKNESVFERKYEEHFQRYGYLDAGTESVLNAATVTTPGANRSIDGRH